ncbi:MAG TPA: thioredoxin [Candidatus Dormibacteraeota bacterium]|nr:thioredoxin [Candidatus Dormibacteraeota bacterium]
MAFAQISHTSPKRCLQLKHATRGLWRGGDTAKAMSAINDVTQASFESEVLKNGEPVLVDFWAPWCGPCRMLSPVVEKVSQKFAGKAKFVKVNTDENPSVTGHYGVSGIPCLILFKGGQVVDRIVGYVPENAIVSMLAKHVAA